jgi:hypothetical protein
MAHLLSNRLFEVGMSVVLFGLMVVLPFILASKTSNTSE